MPSQDCPICGNPADFNGQDYGRRKAFSCRNCTEFIIAEHMTDKLKEAPKEWKDEIIKRAKATPPGQVLTVDLHPDKDDNARLVLHMEYQTPEN